MIFRKLCIRAMKWAFALGVLTGKKELHLGMKQRTFWDGLALGAIAGVVLGFMMMTKEPMTPSERAKLAMERRARRAWRRAQGSIGRIAGRFTGGHV
ncbi:MAG: hypothetical protein ACOX35_04450 [Bacillota bacterium]|jgi:hypothetical protein|nr:hypothetical protein [Candidatus Fermentithermobacillaceae bacterium]